MKIFFFAALVIFLTCSLCIQPTASDRAIMLTAQTSPSPSPRGQAKSQTAALEELQAELKRLDSYEKHGGFKVEISGVSESSGKLNIAFTPSNQSAEGVFRQFDLGLLNIPDSLITQIIIAIFSKDPNTSTLDGVKVRQIGATANYEVVDDYTYQSTNYKITVPKGFVYDRASIPRIFWVIIDKDSLSNVAPLFHDLLYRNGGKLPQTQVSPYRTFSRDDTDNLFYELMTRCGVSYLRRVAAYEAVRKFSGPHWKGQ